MCLIDINSFIYYKYCWKPPTKRSFRWKGIKRNICMDKLSKKTCLLDAMHFSVIRVWLFNQTQVKIGRVFLLKHLFVLSVLWLHYRYNLYNFISTSNRFNKSHSRFNYSSFSINYFWEKIIILIIHSQNMGSYDIWYTYR